MEDAILEDAVLLSLPLTEETFSDAAERLSALMSSPFSLRSAEASYRAEQASLKRQLGPERYGRLQDAISQARDEFRSEMGGVLSESALPLNEEALAERIGAAVQRAWKRAMTAMWKDVTASDVQAAARALMVVGLLNGVTAMVLTDIFVAAMGVEVAVAGVLAVAFVAVFLAPVVEETARREMLKSGGEARVRAFTNFLNISEFIDYTMRMLMGGVPAAVAVGLRLWVACLHKFFAKLQVDSYYRDLAKGKSKEEAGKAGYLGAIALHACWNAFASVISVANAVK